MTAKNEGGIVISVEVIHFLHDTYPGTFDTIPLKNTDRLCMSSSRTSDMSDDKRRR
jgi:hypothetical protein